MRVIAYYTDGSYEAEAALFTASLRRVGMAYTIRRIPDLGGWYANTAYKAVFCQEMRETLTGPLLYIDVDAFVHQNCEDYFDNLGAKGYDYGAHWFRGPSKGHDRSKVREKGWWMLSGTLFLGDTQKCRDLLQTWVEFNALLARHGRRQGGGQKQLWFLVTAHFKDMKIARLPGRYCYVFDKPWAYPHLVRGGGAQCEWCGAVAGHPIHGAPDEPRIIEHTIASRENRDRAQNEPNAWRQERIAQLRGTA